MVEQHMPYLGTSGSSDICPFLCHLYWILAHLEGRIHHWQAPHTCWLWQSLYHAPVSLPPPLFALLFSSPNSTPQDLVHDARKLQCKLNTSQGFLGTLKSAQFQPKFQGFPTLVMAKPEFCYNQHFSCVKIWSRKQYNKANCSVSFRI